MSISRARRQNMSKNVDFSCQEAKYVENSCQTRKVVILELVIWTVLDENTPSNPTGSGLENLRFGP